VPNTTYVLGGATDLKGKDVYLFGSGSRSILQLSPSFAFSGATGVILDGNVLGQFSRIEMHDLVVDCSNRTGYTNGLPVINMDSTLGTTLDLTFDALLSCLLRATYEPRH